MNNQNKLNKLIGPKQMNQPKKNAPKWKVVKNTRKGGRNVRRNPIAEQVQQIKNKGMRTIYNMPSTVQYVHILADPFSLRSAQLPIFPVLPVQTVISRSTIRSVTNASGYGWVAAAPANSFCSNLNSCTVSGPTSGNDINITDVGVSLGVSDSPYITSTFEYDSVGLKGPIYHARMVSFGMRIKYVGKLIDSAGEVVTCQYPDRSITTGSTPISWNALNNVPHKKWNFNNQNWHTLIKIADSEQDFQQVAWSINQPDNSVTSWTYNQLDSEYCRDGYQNMFMMLLTAPGAPFEVEVICHFEIMGKNLQNPTTVPSDRPTVEKAHSLLTTTRVKDTTTKDHVSPSNKPSDTWDKVFSMGSLIGGLLL